MRHGFALPRSAAELPGGVIVMIVGASFETM